MIRVTDEEKKMILESHRRLFEKQVMIQKTDNLTPLEEKGFVGSGWLSETVLIPFLVFQLISALKNASMAGFMKIEEVNSILDKIDKHKGIRK